MSKCKTCGHHIDLRALVIEKYFAEKVNEDDISIMVTLYEGANTAKLQHELLEEQRQSWEAMKRRHRKETLTGDGEPHAA